MDKLKHTLTAMSLLALVSVFFLYEKQLDGVLLSASVIEATLPQSTTLSEPLPVTVATDQPPVPPTQVDEAIIENPPLITDATADDVPTPAAEPPTEPIPALPNKPAPETVPSPSDFSLQKFVRNIESESNLLRSAIDLPDLVLDARLSQLAKERSDDMASRHYLSHVSPEGCDLECRFTNSDFPSRTWGENLSTFEPYDSLDPEQLAKRIAKDWLASKGHRANLLSSTFTHQGIGVAFDGDQIIVTVLFARPE